MSHPARLVFLALLLPAWLLPYPTPAVASDAPPKPPSFVLVVIDTMRADAVSAYGRVQGTTPAIDALAGEGLLFAAAYSHAPWTLPSHVTLFTGRLPSEHHVGWARTRAPDSLVTVAERLSEAGYDTFGVSENIWVSETFNLHQGFEHFVYAPPEGLHAGEPGPRVESVIADFMKQRSPDRPFFLFVNIIDPHTPYTVRKVNRFLPGPVEPKTAQRIPQGGGFYLCSNRAQGNLEILKGLYIGDVAAADTRFARMRGLLPGAHRDAPVITIVTSDHGEQFGEGGIVGHQFSVRNPLLHVPLVVHGLPGVSPAVVDEAVQLADVVPSLLEWAGLPIPETLVGQPLPTGKGEGKAPPRLILGQFVDGAQVPTVADAPLAKALRKQSTSMRRQCALEDRVWGDMRSLVRYPFKLIWYERYAPQLFDLSKDPEETRDLSAERPDVVAELERALEKFQ